MTKETQAIVFQPECEPAEVWISEEDFITIRQSYPVLDQTETIAIHKSFWPALQKAVAELLAEVEK